MRSRFHKVSLQLPCLNKMLENMVSRRQSHSVGKAAFVNSDSYFQQRLLLSISMPGDYCFLSISKQGWINFHRFPWRGELKVWECTEPIVDNGLFAGAVQIVQTSSWFWTRTTLELQHDLLQEMLMQTWYKFNQNGIFFSPNNSKKSQTNISEMFCCWNKKKISMETKKIQMRAVIRRMMRHSLRDKTVHCIE